MLPDHPSTPDTDDLCFWVSELRAGRPNAAEPTFRKIVARVERFAADRFKTFPRVGRFVDLDDVVQGSLIRLLAAFRDIRPASRQHFYALANELIRRELLDLVKHYYGPLGHGTNVADVVVGEGDGEYAPEAPPPATSTGRFFTPCVAAFPRLLPNTTAVRSSSLAPPSRVAFNFARKSARHFIFSSSTVRSWAIFAGSCPWCDRSWCPNDTPAIGGTRLVPSISIVTSRVESVCSAR